LIYIYSNAQYYCIICACHTGQQARVRHVALHELIPATDDFVTYEGSLTQPGCQETVTWIIINKPLYITPSAVRITKEMIIRTRNDTADLLSVCRRQKKLQESAVILQAVEPNSRLQCIIYIIFIHRINDNTDKLKITVNKK